MKFNKILLELDQVKSRTYDRWEIFKEEGKMKIRPSGSKVPRDLNSWADEDRQNLEALKKLTNKILDTNKNLSRETVMRVLETVFKANNKIPDFNLVKDKSGNVEDVNISDDGELSRAKEAANVRLLIKDLQ